MENTKLKDYVIFNIETSGLNPEKDDTICISAVKVVGDKIIDEFFSYVKPSKRISKQVSTITGITNKKVKDAPSIEEVMDKFLYFVGDFVPTSYNVKFDISFINEYLDKHNIKRYETYIDILDFAKEKLSNLPNYAFNSVCKALNLELPKSLKEETVTMANVYKILRDKKYNAIFLDIDGVINNGNTLDNNGALVKIDNR